MIKSIIKEITKNLRNIMIWVCSYISRRECKFWLG